MSRNTNFQKKATSIPDEENEEDDWEGEGGLTIDPEDGIIEIHNNEGD